MRRWHTFALASILILAADSTCSAAEGKTDIFKLALDLTVWTIVVFVLLLIVLKKYAWKPMLEGLQKREDNIRNALEEAKQTREEAQRLREELQEQMNKAGEKIHAMMDEARQDGQKLKEELETAGRAAVQTERDRLRKEIETARDQALQQIWTQAAQLATLISAKAIRRQLSPDDHRRLVDDALADLRQASPN